MAAFSNKFEEFNGDDIDCYLERLSQHFIALELDADDNAIARKRKAVLLSSVGGDTYRVLKDLCFPDAPATRTYDQLTTHLQSFYAPKKLAVAERFRFHSTKQQSGQSVNEFAAQLKKAASACDFGNDLSTNLRDRFICGLQSEALQRKLLSEELTFQQALDRAIADEAARKNVQDITSSFSTMSPTSKSTHGVHKISSRRQAAKPKPQQAAPQSARGSDSAKCWRCGFSNHRPDECRYKNAKCFKCTKIGHLRSECKSAKATQSTTQSTLTQPRRYTQGGARPRVRYVADDYQDSSEDTLDTVFSVGQSSDELKMDVIIDSKHLDMEPDTGCAVSMISTADHLRYFSNLQLQPTSRKFHVYAGTRLTPVGEIMVDVTFNGTKRNLPLIVVQADNHAPPLFGRNWLDVFIPNWREVFMPSKPQYAVKEMTVDKLRAKYAEVFEPGLGTVRDVRATLHLKDDARPIFHKARPVPFALRPAVEAELDRMQKEGIIYPVDISEWATPLVCVPKIDGSVRLCGDYKVTVNQCIHTDQHPIPTPEEVLAKIAGGQKFSKIDLKCAYQQLVLDDKSQELVTINTSRGLFRYTRLPFGTSSSPAIWQRFIDQVLQGLDWVVVIQDDVLVSGSNDEEHLSNLEKVFQRCQKFGLRLKPEKCRFMEDSVVFFSLRVSKDGIQPTDDKIRAVRDAPAPTNVTELRSWLGMLNFHTRFLPNVSTVLHPLHELLGNKEWKWTDKCDEAFTEAKDMLMSAPMLVHYDPKLPLYLAVDASSYGLGAVIMHKLQGDLKPVAYASRTLNQHEKGYGQIDKEGVAIIFGLQKFRSYLYGRHFTILSDHKPLERIFGPKTAIPTIAALRLQRWAIMLAAFDYDIKHVAAKDNVLADALSRLPLPETGLPESKVFHVEDQWLDSLPVASKDVRHATAKDPVLSRVLDYSRSGWPVTCDDLRLRPYYEKRHEMSIEADCLMWGLRVIVPSKLQSRILDELHVAHPGMVRMKEVARSHVWWPNIDREIEELVRGCTGCQQVKSAPAVAPVMPWIWPSIPWYRIHVDFAEKEGRHYLIVMDSHSKWPEVSMMRTTNAEATITVLRNIFARNGLPHQLVSDNGPPFQSEEFRKFLEENGIIHTLVSPYHPASNGAAERFVQSFKRALTAAKNDDYSIQRQISRFLLTYRTTPHATTGVSPAQLFHGRELRTRLSLVKPSVHDRVHGKQSAMVKDRQGYREFFPGDHITVKDMRRDNTWWPGTIAERSAPKTYIIVLSDGRVWRRHVDHIRRAQSDTPAHQDVPTADPYMSSPTVVDTTPSVSTGGTHDTDVKVSSPGGTPATPCTDKPSTPAPSTGPSHGARTPSAMTMRRSTRQRKAPERLVEKM